MLLMGREYSMNSYQLITALAFALYLGLMLAIGFFTFRKTKSTSDYFLGGRSIGPWFTALSAEASDMSGWLLKIGRASCRERV